MPLTLTINNETKESLPAGFKSIVLNLIRAAEQCTKGRFNEVSVVVVEPLTSRQLNRRYRNHDWVTDILSFTYKTEPVMGELVICLAQAKKQAQRRGIALKQELSNLVVHGILHLLGYDHMRARERKIMRILEARILKKDYEPG